MARTTKRPHRRTPEGGKNRITAIVNPDALELLRAIDIPDPGAARILLLFKQARGPPTPDWLELELPAPGLEPGTSPS